MTLRWIAGFFLKALGGYEQGYWAGSNLQVYSVGKGRVIVSTLGLVDNIGKHSAADRQMVNLVNHAGQQARGT